MRKRYIKEESDFSPALSEKGNSQRRIRMNNRKWGRIQKHHHGDEMVLTAGDEPQLQAKRPGRSRLSPVPL
jgi:hypothetical protein